MTGEETALAEPLRERKEFNKKLLLIPILIVIFILLFFLSGQFGYVSEPLPSGALPVVSGDEKELGEGALACACDIEPDFCEDTDCYCDPICQQG